MERISYEYHNPNDMFRKHVKELYAKAKQISALNSLLVEDVFSMILSEVKKSNFKLYVNLLQVMFLDYSISLTAKENVQEVDAFDEQEEEEDEYDFDEDDEESLDEDIHEIENLEDLINFAENNKYVVASMASSIDVREIDLAYIYENMHKLTPETRELLTRIYPSIIFDMMELQYPFILGKIQSNLKTNEFTKETSAKSVAIIDVLDAMKEHAKDDYISMITHFLEIYYKHKKYSMEFFDSIITKKERDLIKLLENGNLTEAVIVLMNDVDLLETVINSYSENYFGDMKMVNEIDKYFLQPKKEEEIKLIFRRNKGE